MEKINGLLIEESQTENEFGAQFIKFHDLIKLDETTLRVQIDPVKFPIFVKENTDKIAQAEKDLSNNEENEF